MSDDDGKGGYRIPARVAPEPVEGDGPLDPPIVRLANAMLLGSMSPEGSLVRAGSWPMASVEQKRAGGRWERAADARGVAPAVTRRFKLMAGLPSHVMREATMGFIHLMLSADREEDLCVFVRPCPSGERVVLRHVPQAQRSLMFSGPPAPESLDSLRWQTEHAFRLARSDTPEKSLLPLRELIAATEALEDGAALRMRAASTLGEVAARLGELDRALDAFTMGCEAARACHGGEGPAYAELTARRADVLRRQGRHEEAVAALVEAVDIARRITVDDPLVPALLGGLASALREVGREEEARARFDEAIAHLSELGGEDDHGVAELVAARDGG